MSRFPRDPFWMLAKYNGRCAGCGKAFKAGSRVFYYPNSRKLLTQTCGEDASREFDCMAMDEAIAGREYVHA